MTEQTETSQDPRVLVIDGETIDLNTDAGWERLQVEACRRVLIEREQARKEAATWKDEAEAAKKALSKIVRHRPAAGGHMHRPSSAWPAVRLAAEALSEVERLRSRGGEIGRLHQRLDRAGVMSVDDLGKRLSALDRLEWLLAERLHVAASVGDACGQLLSALGTEVDEGEVRDATEEELDQATAPLGLLAELVGQVEGALRQEREAHAVTRSELRAHEGALDAIRATCVQAGIPEETTSEAGTTTRWSTPHLVERLAEGQRVSIGVDHGNGPDREVAVSVWRSGVDPETMRQAMAAEHRRLEAELAARQTEQQTPDLLTRVRQAARAALDEGSHVAVARLLELEARLTSSSI